ncbi:hypothetical protein LTS18_014949, partial [Coniosporium uncinatum]
LQQDLNEENGLASFRRVHVVREQAQPPEFVLYGLTHLVPLLHPTIANDLAVTLTRVAFLTITKAEVNEKANLVARMLAPMYGGVQFPSIAIHNQNVLFIFDCAWRHFKFVTQGLMSAE